MKVAIFPDYRPDNPYQQLLAEALGDLGVEAVFPAGYRRVLPFSRALAGTQGAQLLHLHWLTPYLKGRSYPMKVLYALKLWLDCWLVKARGKGLVWTIHNLVSHETSAPRLETWLSRRLAALADGIIAHSDGAKVAVVEQFRVNPAKVTVIPHGSFAPVYGPPMPRDEARKKLGLGQDSTVLLFFGMIRPYKGVEGLLRTWNAMPTFREKAVLVIAGDARDPQLADAIRALAREAANVHLHLRFIPDSEVPMFFGAADCAVLPFTQSLTSGTIALAQSFGLPVVAPKVEGTQGLWDMGGSYLYDVNQPDGLSQALTLALIERPVNWEQQTESRMSGEGNWNTIAASHASIYGDCL